MAQTAVPVPIRSEPGVKRDGTQFEGDNYIDAQWTRFNRGLPRKMGGYQSIVSSLLEKVYGIHSFSQNNIQYVSVGSATMLQQVQVSSSAVFLGINDRTPAGFVNDANNLWQFDVLSGVVGSTASLVAHAAPNLADISSDVETDVYFGDVTAAAALTATGMDPVSGGIVVLSPYLVAYGNAGRVDVSQPNDLTTPPDSAFVTGQKIVKGLPLRGGGSGPSGLLWSLDSLVRMTFNSSILSGVPFSFDTISSETSILSSQGVIEYDGVYYWAGVDRFLMFNGVVREVPNPMNQNWFFDNLNYTWRQKVFAFKVPRWGEIWWCYPRGSATECTHAVILNVREGTWYDTELPGSGRSAGLYAKVYSKPFMMDVDLTATGYTLWQHETGTDAILGASVEPIPAHFTTSEISMLTAQQAADKTIRCARIEPDFVQSGDMTVTVTGRANARAPLQPGELFTFSDAATGPSSQVVNTREVRRLMQFTFSTNTPGGDFQMGQPLAFVESDGGRYTQ
jgi:hypothetical protein